MLAIKVDILPGSTIANTAVEMVELAKRLGCTVEGMFNEVHIFATSTSHPSEIVKMYRYGCERLEHQRETGHELPK